MAPKMLKDFLGDSSNGFTSYPRTTKPDNNSDHHSDPNNLLEQPISNNKNRLSRSRSRSRAAAEAAVSSFQKLINAVKSLQYSSTPSTLPSTVSRRLLGKWQLKKNNKNNTNNSNDDNSSKIVVVTVKVKDILRWRSFRDLVTDHHNHHQSPPSDIIVGPTSYDAPSTTGEEEEEQELPCCNDDEGKSWDEVAASDSEVGPKQDYHKLGSEEGTEQQSPISVLNSPFRDEVSDEEVLSTFDQSFANMERTKQRLLQSIQMFESLAGVHDDDDNDSETEVTEEEQPREDDDTIKGYASRGFHWFEKGGEGLKDKKECLQDVEKLGKWSKFEEERPEVGVELEVSILNDLLDEVLFDLCG